MSRGCPSQYLGPGFAIFIAINEFGIVFRHKTDEDAHISGHALLQLSDCRQTYLNLSISRVGCLAF
jgi:hypothetical protein